CACRSRRTAGRPSSHPPCVTVCRGAPAAGRDYIVPGVRVKLSGRAVPTQEASMCVDNDSRPPIRPIAGGAARVRDLRLTSSDGTRFMAHAARASKPTGAGMVVIPDVRGLHPYYKELADRFAEIGVDAIAIDFFARTAPSDDRGESFDFMSQV